MCGLFMGCQVKTDAQVPISTWCLAREGMLRHGVVPFAPSLNCTFSPAGPGSFHSLAMISVSCFQTPMLYDALCHEHFEAILLDCGTLELIALASMSLPLMG